MLQLEKMVITPGNTPPMPRPVQQPKQEKAVGKPAAADVQAWRNQAVAAANKEKGASVPPVVPRVQQPSTAQLPLPPSAMPQAPAIPAPEIERVQPPPMTKEERNIAMAQAATSSQVFFYCDQCGIHQFHPPRYKSISTEDIDLCQGCFGNQGVEAQRCQPYIQILEVMPNEQVNEMASQKHLEWRAQIQHEAAQRCV